MVTPAHAFTVCPARRRGTILPLVVLTIMAQLAFLALAIDLSMLAIAKTQVQQAADLVALTAARTLIGNSSVNYNQTQATTNAQNVADVQRGAGTETSVVAIDPYLRLVRLQSEHAELQPQFPGPERLPRNGGLGHGHLERVCRRRSARSSVPRFFPMSPRTAQAVHRPRDIALVMDLSGSMRMGTCLGFDFYTSSRTTNNPDTLVPTFGPYSSSSAVMQGPSTNRTSGDENYTISPSNTTASNSSYARTYVNNFYQNAAYASTLIRAFDSYTSSDGGNTWSPPTNGTPVLPPTSYASVPGGDVPLFKSGSTTTYATNVKDVLGSSTRNASWELDGYSNYTNGSLSNAAQGQSNYTSAPFHGYTQGPGYYGVTFFIWPPDPRRPLTTASNSTAIKQFLTDFGYTSTDFSNGTTGPPLYGIYGTTTTSGSRNWPWPNDGGSSLSSYLTSKVYIPGGSRKLTTSDSQYQQIMRLYSWNYVIDNLGTTPCDWRLRFFGTNDNTKIFNTSNGQLQTPGSGTYTINYNEILRWIAQGPNPFPHAASGGPRQILRLDPDGDHGFLAQLRQHRPAVLGRVHRLRPRLQADLRGELPGRQCHGRLWQ